MTDANHVSAFLSDRSARRLVYHRGFLAKDREFSGCSGAELEKRHSLSAAADVLWAASLAGKVFLIQQRHDFGDYSYIAIKASAS